MDRYTVFIAEEVVEVVSTLRGGNKKAIKAFIVGLASNPHVTGDFSEQDSLGRTTYCKVIKDYAVSFYPDHAVKEVKVFEIVRADKL